MTHEGGGWRIPGRKLGVGVKWRPRSREFGAVIVVGRPFLASDAVCGRVEVARWALCSRGSGCERGGVSPSVAVEREPVDHEGVAQEVEVLAVVADAVGSAEPECVVEVAVDGLGVVAARVEAAKSGSVGAGWVGRSRSGSASVPCPRRCRGVGR